MAEMEAPQTKENYVRANRPNEFKEFDKVAIQYLSQGLEIPEEWEVYSQALRDMTKDMNDSKVELVGGVWTIHWPVKPE